MRKHAALPALVAAGFVFVTTGILADGMILKVLYATLGMASLLAGVLSARQSGQEQCSS